MSERSGVSRSVIVERILPSLNGVREQRSRSGWSFFCPLAHRKRDASAVIWVDGDGWIRVHCFDCRRDDELRDELVVPHFRGSPPYVPLSAPPAVPRSLSPSSGLPQRLWSRCEPIPLDRRHPARRWLSRRSLWDPGAAVPASLRWLPARLGHQGAGSLVAALASPSAWQAAWPGLPVPGALELLSVDSGGVPALDRPGADGGLSKRTLGGKTGMVFLVGDLSADLSGAPVRVAEGVADALALAAHFPGLAVATLGDAGMSHPLLADWLAGLDRPVVVHADDDPAGRRAAGRLRVSLLLRGRDCRVVLPRGGKDPADVAAALGLLGFPPRGPERSGRSVDRLASIPASGVSS